MSEVTPLLQGHQVLPPISQTVARLSILDVNGIAYEDVLPNGVPLPNQPTKIAFALICLLRLRQTKLQQQTLVLKDIYENWAQTNTNKRDADILDRHITGIWTLFLEEYRSAGDIEMVLWTEFPAEDGAFRTFRVLDFLFDSGSPTVLTSHSLVVSSLSHTWRHGLSTSLVSFRSSSHEWLRWYDACSTPSIAHFIDLLSQLAFLTLLIHYLLHPPQKPHVIVTCLNFFGMREALLVILPLAFLVRPWSRPNSVFFFVPLAFLASLPSVPFPGDTSFAVLLWGLALHIFRLHLPLAPSPLFLFSFNRSIPLAILLSHGLYEVTYPVILFFFPVFLLASFLLSFSLADAFLKSLTVQVAHNAAPMETRIAFLILFTIVPLVALSSIFILATTTFSRPKDVSDIWARYSEETGKAARKALLRAVLSYAGRRYTFPPPFNLVHILFVRLPSFIARLLGIRISYGEQLERVLWRVTVGPFMVFCAILIWIPKSYRPRPVTPYFHA